MNTTNKFCVACVHYKSPAIMYNATPTYDNNVEYAKVDAEDGTCSRVVRLGVSPVTGKNLDKALDRTCAFERGAHYHRHGAHFEERLCNPEGIYWERKT